MVTDEELYSLRVYRLRGFLKTAFHKGLDKTGNQKQDIKIIDTIVCFCRISKKKTSVIASIF